MEKKTHKYHLQLTKIEEGKTIDFDFENHDDIFKIIDIIKEKNPFEDENQAVEFAIGLKLFSEVMLKNRKHPLFEEFGQEFGKFMKKLKGK